eukprot:13098-Heterococcus_DN1.PRE.4
MVKDEPIDAEEAEVDRKPGQKYPTPSQGSADRVFYESLYRQKPQSEMAQDWCIAYGVLPHNEAGRLYKAACKRKGVKAEVVTPSKLAKAPAKKKAKRTTAKGKVIEDTDADTGFEDSGAFEGVGAAGIYRCSTGCTEKLTRRSA